MRQAAGIMLIIFGMFLLIVPIISLSMGGSLLFPLGLLPFVFSALLVSGGVFCLKRRYWRACLASALLALYIGISMVVGPLLRGHLLMTWYTWIPVLGAVTSIVFIFLKKKEWQKSQA